MEVHNQIQILRAMRREVRATRKTGKHKKLHKPTKIINALKNAEIHLEGAIKELDKVLLAEDLDYIDRRDKKGQYK